MGRGEAMSEAAGGDVVRVRIRAEGRVQGVFFRSTVQDEAERRGVSGWVRNRDDGAVDGEFQGPRDAVDDLVDVCREGSAQARVTDLEVEEIDPVDAPGGFQVR